VFPVLNGQAMRMTSLFRSAYIVDIYFKKWNNRRKIGKLSPSCFLSHIPKHWELCGGKERVASFSLSFFHSSE